MPTVWHYVIVAGLLVSAIGCIWLWLRLRRRYASTWEFMTPGQQFVMRHGWLFAMHPVGEALLLWKAGFFG